MIVKGLHAGGWHDLFLKGSIENYRGLREKGTTPEVREGQRLLLGPWCHGPTSPEGRIGDVLVGPDAVIDINQVVLEWFDYALKGAVDAYTSRAPVRLFVMGENKWRDEAEFPLARTRVTRYFLRSARAANSTAGDGALNLEAPRPEPPAPLGAEPERPLGPDGGPPCAGRGSPPSPSTSGPRATSSRRDTGSACTSRAATSRGSAGTSTRESPPWGRPGL